MSFMTDLATLAALLVLLFPAAQGHRVWGVNRHHHIYTRVHGNWKKIDGGLKHIAVQSNGRVWGVNRNDDIWTRNGISGSWQHIGGKLKQISVNPSTGEVWGVNSGDNIYYRNGVNGSWKHIGGKLKYICVQANGRVWGVNSNDQIYTRAGVNSGWQGIDGRLKQISVNTKTGRVWGVNSADDIYTRPGVSGSWHKIGGKLKHISVAEDDTVWGVNSAEQIYTRRGVNGSWTRISGGLMQVDVQLEATNCRWHSWGGWGGCSKSCGDSGYQYRFRGQTGATGGGRGCSGSNKESRVCNRKICPVKSIRCTDLHIPSENELPKFCSATHIDIINFGRWTTPSEEEIEYEFTQGSEEQISRTTSSGFTSDFGWNFSKENSAWSSVSQSTEILIKDPEVNVGFSSPYGGGEAGHSCFNEQSVSCTVGSTMGIGSNDLATFVGNRRRRLFGLIHMANALGGSDPNRCKCTETTTTTTKESGQERKVSVGKMMNQGRSMEETFNRTTFKHRSETIKFKCPGYSECLFAHYSVMAVCAIPYWGTCTLTHTDKYQGKLTSTYTIKRNDTKNVYYTKQTFPQTFTYGPSISSRTTNGAICGVLLTPVIDNLKDNYHPDHIACPSSAEAGKLPNCDCMLPQYKDCGTKGGKLIVGDRCAMNVRFISGQDNEICLTSQPGWRQINNCKGQDIFYVVDYNDKRYGQLLAGLSAGTAGCKDDSGFKDSYGDGCSWYNVTGRTNFCDKYANSAGVTARKACCVCKGQK